MVRNFMTGLSIAIVTDHKEAFRTHSKRAYFMCLYTYLHGHSISLKACAKHFAHNPLVLG